MKHVNNHSFTTIQHFVSACADSCQEIVNRINEVRGALLGEFRREAAGQDRMLHLALNEAEALAHETGFQLLVFPTLAREKAEAVAAWTDRQQLVRRGGVEMQVA